MKKTLVLIILGLSGTAWSYDRHQSYDNGTGNMYTWETKSGGDVEITVINSNTGNSYINTLDSNGSIHGYDSKGNTWYKGIGSNTSDTPCLFKPCH